VPDRLSATALREDWHHQWQASPLLRTGTWAIGLLLLLYAVLWLDDTLSLMQLEWRREAVAISEMSALQQQDYWPALVQSLEQQRQALLGQAWQAGTPGLAKAAVREFIGRTAGANPFELTLRQTEFAEPQPLAGGVWEMRGRVSATAEGSTAPWGWIAALEGHRPAFIIDSLELRVGLRAGVTVVIEFRVPIHGLEAAPE